MPRLSVKPPKKHQFNLATNDLGNGIVD